MVSSGRARPAVVAAGKTAMTEASDSAQGKPVEAAPAVQAPAAPAASTAYQDLSPPREDSTESYRSLSMLAAASLATAALYAVVVVLSVLVTLFSKTPSLLSLWTFLVPMTAVLLAWIARSRIQTSEGVLTGLALTRWSVGLSVAVGLSYAGYFAATALAIRQQADHFARRWIEEMKKGETENAFCMTLPPPPPTPGPARRKMLEVLYNMSPDFSKPETLSGFEQARYVRLLENAGDKAQVELISVNSWGYQRGGYEAGLTYRITTPMAVFSLQTTVHGGESEIRKKDLPGRQWNVVLAETRMNFDAPMDRPGDSEGKLITDLWQLGNKATFEWMTNVHLGTPSTLGAAFFSTCPPTEQAELAKLFAPGHAEKLLDESLKLSPENQKRRKEFLEGDRVEKAKEKDFYADDEKVTETALAEIRKLFKPGNEIGRAMIQLTAGKGGIPRTEQDGDRYVLGYDFQMMIRQPEPIPPMLVEMRVKISFEKPDPAKGFAPAQIEKLELIRARRGPPKGAPPPRGM
jgi:hypothetical protein